DRVLEGGDLGPGAEVGALEDVRAAVGAAARRGGGGEPGAVAVRERRDRAARDAARARERLGVGRGGDRGERVPRRDAAGDFRDYPQTWVRAGGLGVGLAGRDVDECER